MSSITELRKRVKELRGAIVGSVASAGEEELKKEILYHESAVKSAEREKKRGEALAKAREAKIAKGKAKKEGAAEKVKEVKVEKVKEVKEVKPKVEKVKVEKPVVVEQVVLSKNIRVKKSKDADE